jgi:hypothetical protein
VTRTNDPREFSVPDALAVAGPIPLTDVDDVEQPNTGKVVAEARLRLEERHGPSPARQVVSIETRDGCVYRFQRYAAGEYLAFFNRTNAEGKNFLRATALPEHVEAVRVAVQDGRVFPALEDLLDVPDALGIGIRAGDSTGQQEAVADGGEETDPFEGVHCPKCGERPYVMDDGTFTCECGHDWSLLADGGQVAEDDAESETWECDWCDRGAADVPPHARENGLCPYCREQRRQEQAEADRATSGATWVDDPAAGTYGDRGGP